MRAKPRKWISFTLILILSWIDYQFFNEGKAAAALPEMKRQISHIFCFVSILGVGFWGWLPYPYWLSRIWLYLYSVGLILILAIGIIHTIWQPFSLYFLDQISSFRQFFISPIPFLLLLLLEYLSKIFSADDNNPLS
jgi:hypothetical protein